MQICRAYHARPWPLPHLTALPQPEQHATHVHRAFREKREEAAEVASWWLSKHLQRQDAFRHWLALVVKHRGTRKGVARFVR